MWSIFEAKCVKVVSFSIIQDFASTEVDALRIGGAMLLVLVVLIKKSYCYF